MVTVSIRLLPGGVSARRPGQYPYTGNRENTHRYQYVILTSIYIVQLVGTYVCRGVTDDGQDCVSSQVRAINVWAIPAAGKNVSDCIGYGVPYNR